MDSSDNAHGFETTVTRYYIDIRRYAPITTNRKQSTARVNEELPLLTNLPKDAQEKIVRYHRASDRFMSLASALLKYFYIHKAARIPWSEVEVSRTPKPHLRPYWQPPTGWQMEDVGGLEFNVSHQAGIVVLVGCYLPFRLGNGGIQPTTINPDPTEIREIDSEIDEDWYEDARIGVDIACTNESSQTANAKTQNDVNEWVDVFAEMFSKREILSMKFAPVPDNVDNEVREKIRRFFTYWALKEAYIKMVGEGLMAEWLRDLEFDHVVAPMKPNPNVAADWVEKENAQSEGLKITFKGKNITRTMRTDIESFEDTFVVATMFRGIKEKPGKKQKWVAIDFEKDIRPCAEGTCSCLL